MTALPGLLGAEDLRPALARLPYKIVYETYDTDNWELFAMNADGKKIAWGEDDHKIAVAELAVDADQPKIGRRLLEIAVNVTNNGLGNKESSWLNQVAK